MTAWDKRAFLRALGATVLGLVVVWLVTAASDEGQLTVGARAGRTLPVAPLASAVGAALALGTARVRDETRAFEALGRSPHETARAAALGAALPSVVIALAIAAVPSVDVAAFYPRAMRGDDFTYAGGAFTSTSLAVRVDADGETQPIDALARGEDHDLPAFARAAAASATAVAGVALALVAATAALRTSFVDRRRRRARRARAIAQITACAVLTLVAFQAAGARVAPAALAILPPLGLLALATLGRRARYRGARESRA